MSREETSLHSAGDLPTIDVVICAYTEDRWHQLKEAVRSVGMQSSPPQRTLIVVDHNPTLLDRCRTEFVAEGVEVFANRHERGLSGARNTGVDESTADAVAFLDDDAKADRDWLALFRHALGRDGVVGVGGRVVPEWAEEEPAWFPSEFGWVVGCTYRGMPTEPSPVRNPIGASMAFTAEALAAGGAFDSGLGRIGAKPVGCEETELSIRVQRRYGPRSILYVPDSVVYHHVSPGRATSRYFLRRCWSEGRSKAVVAARTGAEQALESERRYARSTLPAGVFDGMRRPLIGWLRAGMIIAGLCVTGLGYATGQVRRSTGVVDL